MWTTHTESIGNGRAYKYTPLRDGAPIAYADALALWRDDAAFREFFIGLLADAPFAAYRWETPPVTAATVGSGFEFVLLRCGALERRADRGQFARHFSDDPIVTFANLGGDAVLVVPCPVADESCYPHLAAFVRGAPPEQAHQLWQAVAAAMERRLGDRPVWLSTAGMGVAWLHVRLDSQPKYYGHAPYKRAT